MTAPHTIDHHTIVVQRGELLASEIDDEIVLLDMDAEKYYGMDAVGTRIWQLLARPWRILDLCDQVLTEFEVDRSTCEREILEFIQRLSDARLVQVVHA